jgi:hypothetical protein
MVSSIMFGIVIMNRSDFLDFFLENDVINLSDCLCYHYEFERPVNELFKLLMNISDVCIDIWIDEVLFHVGNLREFYEETRGCSHESHFFTEAILLEDVRDKVCDVVDLFEGYGIMETDLSTQTPASLGTVSVTV